MPSAPIDVATAVPLLRALSNAARLRIVLRLLDGECAVAELEADLGLRQPNLSQHLAALRDAGLVVTRRESRSVFYRVADGTQRLAAALASGLGGAALPTASVPMAVRPRSRQAAVFATVGRSV